MIAAGEETLYVSVEAGADPNSGTKQSPLKTLVASAKRVKEGKGTGPALNFQPLDPAIMDLSPSIPVVDGPVKIVKEEYRRDFLHVAEGTLGSDLGAGLFTKKA